MTPMLEVFTLDAFGTTIRGYKGEDELVILEVGSIYIIGVGERSELRIPFPMMVTGTLADARKACDIYRKELNMRLGASGKEKKQ